MSVPYTGFSDAERTVYPLPCNKEWGLVHIGYLNYCVHSNTELANEIARLRETGVSCSAVLKALYTEKEEICNTLSKLREEKERLSDELQGLCGQEEQAIAMEELEEEIADLENHNQKLLDKETDYRQEIIDLKKRIAELENGDTDHGAALDAKDSLIAQLVAKDVASLEENCKLKERIVELEGCFGKLKARNAELEDLIGTQELRHTKEILQLKETISTMEKNHDETVAADVQKIAGDLMKTQVEPLRRDLKSLEEEKKELVKLNKSLEEAQVCVDGDGVKLREAKNIAKSMVLLLREKESYLKVTEPILNDLFEMLTDAIAVSIKGTNKANMSGDQLRLLEYELKVSDYARTIAKKAGMPEVFDNYKTMIRKSMQNQVDVFTAALDSAKRLGDGHIKVHAALAGVDDDDTPLLRQAP